MRPAVKPANWYLEAAIENTASVAFIGVDCLRADFEDTTARAIGMRAQAS